MGRDLQAGVVRAFGRVASRLVLVVGALAVAAVLVAPSAAFAETGEPCKDVELKSGGLCFNESGHHNSFIETESWNSNGTGHGSCTGVLGFNSKEVNIKEIKCSTNGSGYREVYCTTKCKGLEGYAYVWNRESGSTSFFTAWANWSS